MKLYYKVKENDKRVTDLKVEVYYSLGGMNYFTYRQEGRGYYLSVTPVERGNGFEGFMAFSGIKKLLREVKRKSAKAEAEAESMVEQEKQELIDYVLRQNGLELA